MNMLHVWPICLLGLFLALFLVACDQQRSNTVIIILPKSSKGVFAIKEDPKTGESVGANKESIRLVIPKSGLLLVREARFLYAFHKTRVYYDDDTEVSYYTADIDASSDKAFGCWGLVSTSDTHYYYVGVLSDKAKLKDLPIETLEKHLFKPVR